MVNLNAEMSVYKNCKSTSPIANITIAAILQDIQTGKYRKEVRTLQQFSPEEKKARDTYKNTMIPCINYTGIFQERKNDKLLVPSGFMILDIDDVPDDDLDTLKTILSEDMYVVSAFASPSGAGLKVVVYTTPYGCGIETYKSKYLNVLDYFATRYNIPVKDGRSKSNTATWGLDQSCSDIARLCIYSVDYDMVINEAAIPFDCFNSYSATESKVISVLQQIEDKQLDITAAYPDWFAIGCALKHEFGEAGRGYYHQFSKYFPDYTTEEVDKKFDSILGSNGGGITIASLFGTAKASGLNIKSESTNTDEYSSEIDIHTANDKEFYIPYKAFPTHLFCEEASIYIREVQESLKCAEDTIGVAVLAAISSAIGNTRMISTYSGHTESANLFLALVAEPSSKKSPAFKKANIAIDWLQMKAKNKYDTEMKNYKIAVSIWEKSEPNTRGKLEQPPVLQQYMVTDFTTEVLNKILSQNQRGISVVVDELAGWINGMDLYRKGNDRQKWLSIWSRENIKVDRKSDEPIFIKNPYVTVAGGIQPEVIRDFCMKNRRDGFIDRLLFAYPNRIFAHSNKAVSAMATDKYFNLIKDLYAFENPIKDLSDEFSAQKITIPTFHLDAEANELWDQWNYQLIAEITHPFFPYYLEGSWGKLVGHTLRFALIFYCLNSRKRGISKYVTADDMRCAFELTDYFKHQIFKVLSYCNDSEVDLNVADVYARAKKNGGTIKARDVYKGKIGKCKTAADVEKIFKEMEERKAGKISKSNPPNGGKATLSFTISEHQA